MSSSLRLKRCTARVRLGRWVGEGVWGMSPPPSSVGLYAAVLQERLFALAGSALRAVRVALRAVVVLFVAAGPHVDAVVLRNEESNQQGQQH